MVLIAKRACVVGATGVTVSITLHPAARGAIPRKEMEVRRPRSATGVMGQLILRFQRAPVLAQKAEHIGGGETESTCAQPFAATMDGGDIFSVSREDCVVLFDMGATANLARFSRQAHHNRILGKYAIPRVATYPARARFLFGAGRLGEVRHATDVPVGVARNRSMLTAFVLAADIPALAPWRAPGGQVDFYADRRF